ncbi:MAG: hypothetical protein K2Y29_06335 [Beijerinckiaceae bacterium]|nr:hypothetical protein [Beijerinckiaceae bacterium]
MTSYYARTSRRRSSGMDWSMGADNIMNMMQRKPEALLLIGAGVALMMRRGRGFNFFSSGSRDWSSDTQANWREDRNYGGSRSSGRSYQPTGDDGSDWSQSSQRQSSRGQSSGGMMSSARGAMNDAGEMASDAADSMTNYASGMMQRVGDTASSYASSASRWAGDAREGLMDRSQWIAERARTLPEELDEAVQDHPLVLAALGVAMGAALGATLPTTSLENRAMGETRDQLLDAAQGATGRLGEAAEEAYDEAWRTAQSHGLSKDGLKEMARDVGEKFASAATGSSENVQGGSQGGGSQGGGSQGGGSQTGSGSSGGGTSSASTASAPGGGGTTPRRDDPRQT